MDFFENTGVKDILRDKGPYVLMSTKAKISTRDVAIDVMVIDQEIQIAFEAVSRSYLRDNFGIETLSEDFFK